MRLKSEIEIFNKPKDVAVVLPKKEVKVPVSEEQISGSIQFLRIELMK